MVNKFEKLYSSECPCKKKKVNNRSQYKKNSTVHKSNTNAPINKISSVKKTPTFNSNGVRVF